MRAVVFAFVIALFVPGCFGGSGIGEPSTSGDQGRTSWHVDDGLCDGGFLGGECDLNQHIAVGAAPIVVLTARNGTDLVHAHIASGPNVALTNASSTRDDHGAVTIRANVRGLAAGVGDVVVLDALDHEIDRVHLTFVTATTLECGLLGSTVTRDLTFHALSTQPVTMTPGVTSTLACRATDEAGNPLLTVDAIAWTPVPSATASLTLQADEIFSFGPAVGGTVHAIATGTGTATARATLGAVSADVVLNVR